MTSDAQLVLRVRAGDDDAVRLVLERHGPRLVAYARGILGGAHHDAEEVVQDALLRAVRALRADDRPILLGPWLYAIVRNCAFDARRRPYRTVALDGHLAVLPDAGGDPHERAVRREALAGLVAGLRALPERQREAIVLHELGGASHAAIGRRLGVSAGGSKALVHRARQGLQAVADAA